VITLSHETYNVVTGSSTGRPAEGAKSKATAVCVPFSKPLPEILPAKHQKGLVQPSITLMLMSLARTFLQPPLSSAPAAATDVAAVAGNITAPPIKAIAVRIKVGLKLMSLIVFSFLWFRRSLLCSRSRCRKSGNHGWQARVRPPSQALLQTAEYFASTMVRASSLAITTQ
jgi:hypothetical protein